MKKQYFLNLTFALSLVATSLVAASVVHAQQVGNVELKNIAEIEVETKDVTGKITRKRTPADKAVPGTTIIYTTTVKNIGNKPVGDIVINNPVPQHTTLVAGSVFGANTDITYSVDGKTFATPDKLKVKGKDGKEVSATASDYSHIRWTMRGNLVVGKTGEVGFRATVK